MAQQRTPVAAITISTVVFLNALCKTDSLKRLWKKKEVTLYDVTKGNAWLVTSLEIIVCL